MPKKTAAPLPLCLRLATAADARTLVGLIRKYYAHDGIPFRPKEIASGLKKLLGKDAPGWAWLAMSGRKIVGYAVCTRGFDYEFGGTVATITDLYLEPQFRGKGLGRGMLEHIETHCRRAGVSGLELQVERHNAPARKLYAKFGFEALDRIPMSKRIKHA